MEVGNDSGFFIKSDGTFHAYLAPIDLGEMLLKAEPRGQTKVFPFKGTASTPDKDREGEILLQKGLDFSPFKEYGEYNWNHIPYALVGLPVGTKAWFEEGIWKSQGEIISGLEAMPGYTTDMIVAQHNQLKKAGFNRGLCQSVEGKVLKRSTDGKYVEKASITNIALTFRPINPNCSITMLAKSFAKQTPLLIRDGFYEEELKKALTVAAAAPVMKQDLEGGSKDALEEKLIKHFTKKLGSVYKAKAHVYAYLDKKFSKR